MAGVLSGIRVIEWAAYHAGPAAAEVLADLGAEVIKIEPTGQGYGGRGHKPIGAFATTLPGGRDLMFEASNRNKKSITLNLGEAEGRELACRLVEKADAFVTNYRGPVLAKRGMDYQSLHQRNPRLVYAHISAFGSKGPDADRGGFDFQGQARSGFMTAIGEPGAPPAMIQLGVIDHLTAFTASYGVVAALLARERTGIGQEVDVSLLGSAMNILHVNITCNQLLGVQMPKHQRSAAANPLRNHYQCQDGSWLVVTHAPPDKYWAQFCRSLGVAELIDDPRFCTEDLRSHNAAALIVILDAVFARRTRDEWLKIGAEADLVFAPISSVADLATDPQVTANEYLIDFDFPGLGVIKVPGFPIRFSETPARVRRAAPDLGEHTDEVLGEILDVRRPDVDDLRRRGIV